MHFSKLLAFAGLAAAIPTAVEVRSHEPTWTLKDFNRRCDDTQNVCTYKFTIATSGGNNWPCEIYDYVRPTEPGGGVRSARYSSPSNLACKPGSPIFVNVGYDKPGNFWVIVPVHTGLRKNAFFGYDANEMRDGNVVRPDKTSKELVWGQFKREAEAESELVARNHLGTWTVKKLARKCEHNKCNYNFEIHRSIGGGPITCATEIAGPNTQSWYAIACKDAPNWVISWGYNTQFGYAVMTVISASQQQNAWFGFNNVNSNTNFPEVGPSTVAAIV